MIHAIVIMKSTGEILVSETFGNSINPALLSGFLSALTSFGRELLQDQILDTVELGQYRVFLEPAVVEEVDLIFAALTERRDNVAGIRPKLNKILGDFIATKYNEILNGKPGNLDQFEDFKPRLRQIVRQKVVPVSESQKVKVLSIFQRLYELSEFAIGAALLTQSGDILQVFMEPEDLENITRLLEGRFLAGANNLREIISIEERGILVLLGTESLITAVMFSSICPLGTAELFARRFADQISQVIEGSR
ncbi:MAG TPA: hypothetical protein VKK79_09855 [Candidatus Lokiarchaeia archaeon]|nr:hypothetical protein [Candidatus Lokiarchaeia archaeon]